MQGTAGATIVAGVLLERVQRVYVVPNALRYNLRGEPAPQGGPDKTLPRALHGGYLPGRLRSPRFRGCRRARRSSAGQLGAMLAATAPSN
jgi:hypothetical protein